MLLDTGRSYGPAKRTAGQRRITRAWVVRGRPCAFAGSGDSAAGGPGRGATRALALGNSTASTPSFATASFQGYRLLVDAPYASIHLAGGSGGLHKFWPRGIIWARASEWQRDGAARAGSCYCSILQV